MSRSALNFSLVLPFSQRSQVLTVGYRVLHGLIPITFLPSQSTTPPSAYFNLVLLGFLLFLELPGILLP
jgi:hypothetical protein